MVDAVEEEVQGESDAIVGKVAGDVSVCWEQAAKCTHSSRWNKHRWRTYSMIVQNPSPNTQ